MNTKAKRALLGPDLVFRSTSGVETFPHAGSTIIGSAAAGLEILFTGRDAVMCVLEAHRAALAAWWTDAELLAVADYYAEPAGGGGTQR